MKPNKMPCLLAVLIAILLQVPLSAEMLALQWEKRYNGPANGNDVPSGGVAVDSVGNVIVAGSSAGILRYQTNDDLDFYTAKYAAADGTLLWEKRYDGPFNRQDGASAAAVDADGNVLVTGSSMPIVTGTRTTDFYTAKYAAADGAMIWERRYNGPAANDDRALAVALDSEGNAIVTGSSGGDYYTAKYAAASGAVLWERRSNGGGTPLGLSLDGGGNAIVTGISPTNQNSTGMYTVKYASSNGSLLWERRYNPLGNGLHYPGKLAVDAGGNVVVTGMSPGVSGNDSYTVKYAAANGATLWERRYNGNENGYYSQGLLSIDNEGNAIITGQRQAGGQVTEEIFIAKYASADGTVEWMKNFSVDGADYYVPISDMIVDRAGDILVLRRIAEPGGMYESYMAKYAGQNGVLLWERRNGPVSYGGKLALLPDGGIAAAFGYGTVSASQDYNTLKLIPEVLDQDDDGLLDSWEIAHFGGREGQRALDDTDGDGAVELLELAFGTDPRASNALPAPAVVIEGGYLTTTITKQACVRYLIETSATPEAGFSATSTTVLTDTATTLKVRDNILISAQPARFLRAQVTAAP